MEVYHLRRMTMDDALFMLSLKNDPDTRKFAIASHDEIKLEDHLKWLKDNIQYFRVLIYDNTPAGAIRVQDEEISIWIDRAFRRKGLATETIKKVSDWGMTAKIVNGNIGSMRAFIESGFLPIKYIDNYYIFQK